MRNRSKKIFALVLVAKGKKPKPNHFSVPDAPMETIRKFGVASLAETIFRGLSMLNQRDGFSRGLVKLVSRSQMYNAKAMHRVVQKNHNWRYLRTKFYDPKRAALSLARHISTVAVGIGFFYTAKLMEILPSVALKAEINREIKIVADGVEFLRAYTEELRSQNKKLESRVQDLEKKEMEKKELEKEEKELEKKELEKKELENAKTTWLAWLKSWF